MNIVKTYVSDIKNEFSGYNFEKFTKDIMAGITVAAVALPLALAFGVGSGATAAAGLVTAIIGGIIISIFSGASFQISGPTGAMTAILVTLAAQYGIQGILVASFLAGCMLVLAGIFKLGKVIALIPSSVITGFTSGIAITIALGQLDNFFGVTSHGDIAIAKVFSYFTDGFHPDIPTMCIGLGVILLMVFWPKKLNEKLPSSLAAIILIVILMQFWHPDVAVVGDIPKSLFLSDRLNFGELSFSELRALIVPAFSIAALGMIESLLCGSSAGKMKNEEMNADRELIAQGIGNIVIPFFGGVPATAAIARTSVAIKAGAETRVAGIFHSIVLLASMLILSPIMSQIPLAALAGILMVTAWRMNDWNNIRFIFGHKFKSGMAKFLVTMIATVIFDLTKAIIIGVGLATFMIVVGMADLEITVKTIQKSRLEKKGIDIPEVSDKIKIAYLTGTIFFADVDKLIKKLRIEEERTDILILSMRGVPVIDLSGVQGMIELIETLQAGNTAVYLTSVQPAVLDKMARGGIVDMIGSDYVFKSAEQAIVIAQQEFADED